MKIKPLAETPKPLKISVKLQPETVQKTYTYLSLFEQEYGTKSSIDFIVNEILDNFFSSDRDFAAYLKKNKLVDLAELPVKQKKSKKNGTNAEV